MTNAIVENKSTKEHFLEGGGEMGERIRSFDWSKTSLGPISAWPQSLKTCVRIMLTSSQPIWIGWGPDLVKLYNDPYKAIVGGKHPQALGQPASVVWKDIWRDIEPMLNQVMKENQGTYVEEQLLIMERYGYPEETYYTFSYTPVPGDDGGTAGMICFNTDDTQRIISERELKTFTGLGQTLNGAQSEIEVFQRSIATFSENTWDFPFAIFYKTTEAGFLRTAHTNLSGTSLNNVEYSDNILAPFLNKTIHIAEPLVIDDLTEKIEKVPTGAWSIPPSKALALPITETEQQKPFGILLVGLNPYILLNEEYFRFFLLLAGQVGRSLANVHFIESERKQAAALAEIDRAKTIFFSNISHEFRTPLTLLLGPINEAINNPDIPPIEKENLQVAYRNALRMQKLTNTLLDFSRIEAGRMQGSFQKVDIGNITTDLASTFRSAIEKAGMNLSVECENIIDDVYVDVNMWEKIVLNLISNAFKYTQSGKITVCIKKSGNDILLVVEDTGVGIPESEFEKIFERFHRVETTQGRSQEGTGIGLAMVRELVKLHGGTITVESKIGEGSRFTVNIPAGKSHLANEKILIEAPVIINSTADQYLSEANEWTNNNNHSDSPTIKTGYKILLADDNADMRQYVKKVLSPRFIIEVARDGEEAFDMAVRLAPDLIISDIMMPRLDGYGLLNKLKEHPELKSVPLIFLSARAGEEAKIEGLDAGADDYLIKPFSAKELIAVAESNIRLSVIRRATEKSEKYFRQLADSVPATLWRTDKNDRCIYLNKRWSEFTGQAEKDALGFGWLKVTHPDDKENAATIFANAAKEKKPFHLLYRLRTRNGNYRWCQDSGVPIYDTDGNFEGYIGSVIDVHEEKTAKDALHQSLQELQFSEERFRLLATSIPQIVWTTNSDGIVDYLSDQWKNYTGSASAEDWASFIHPDHVDKAIKAWEVAYATGEPWNMEYLLRKKTGEYRWFIGHAQPLKDENGHILKWIGAATDVHDLKEQAALLEQKVHDRTLELNESAQALQQSNENLQQFAHVASHDLREPVRKIKTFANRMQDEEGKSLSEKGKTYLEKIQHATDRMSSMIEGVLHYSMINSLQGEIETINLNKLITDVCADLELIISEKKATVQYNGLATIEGAKILIYQLFYNLINNSLKFAKDGVPPQISFTSDIATINGREFAIIKMKDNGIGFEQGAAEKIFQTFERLHSKDKYEGTGLGLALCRKIVQRHQGAIKAEGAPGQGAVFTIQLPLQQ